MTDADATSLVAHINMKSTRFKAAKQVFFDNAWVLIRDINLGQQASIEPILNLRSYLDREDRFVPIDTELRALLAVWLKQTEEATKPSR